EKFHGEQEKHTHQQKGPERHTARRRSGTFLTLCASVGHIHIQARSDLRFTLVKEIDREATLSACAFIAVEARFQGIGKNKGAGSDFQLLFSPRRGRDLQITITHRQTQQERRSCLHVMGGEFDALRLEPLDGIVKQNRKSDSQRQVRSDEIKSDEQQAQLASFQGNKHWTFRRAGQDHAIPRHRHPQRFPYLKIRENQTISDGALAYGGYDARISTLTLNLQG